MVWPQGYGVVNEPLFDTKHVIKGWRFLLFLVGALLVLVAGPIMLLPGPGPGPILAFFGLILVLRNSIWARREFVKAKRRWPRFMYPVRKFLRKGWKGKRQVIWQSILRAERFLPRKWRIIIKWRRRQKRRRKRYAMARKAAR